MGNKLLDSAIADAAEVRKFAIENAKKALQEAFVPKVSVGVMKTKTIEEMRDEVLEKRKRLISGKWTPNTHKQLEELEEQYDELGELLRPANELTFVLTGDRQQGDYYYRQELKSGEYFFLHDRNSLMGRIYRGCAVRLLKVVHGTNFLDPNWMKLMKF